jgi:hypothetical protein
MKDVNKNLATVESDSVASADPGPQSSETVMARAIRAAVAKALPIPLGGIVTGFRWTDPTLLIRTSTAQLNSIQVKATTGDPNGTYFTNSVSAKLAIDAVNLTNLRNSISIGMTVQLTYDPGIDTNTSTNCINFTYGATSVTLKIIPV